MAKDLAALIREISPEKQQALLLKYALLHSDLRQEILSTRPSKSKRFDDIVFDEWKSRVFGAVDDDVDDGEVEEYYNQKYVEWSQTEKVLSEAVTALVERGMAKEALELIDVASEAVEEASSEDTVDSDYGDMYVEYDCDWIEAFRKLRIQAAKADPAYRKKLFDELAESASKGDLSESWLKDYSSPEDKSIQLKVISDYLAQCFKRKDRYFPSDYLNAAVSLFKEIKPEDLEAFFEKYRSIAEVRKLWRAELEDQKNFLKTIPLLEEDIAEDPKDVKKSDLLIDLYQKVNDQQKLKDELIRRVEKNVAPSVHIFDALEKLIPEKQFKSIAQKFIDDPQGDKQLRMVFCEQFGEVEKLKDLLVSAMNSPTVIGWSQRLEDPLALAKRYDKFISKSDKEFVPHYLIDYLETHLAGQTAKDRYEKLAERLAYLCTSGEREKLAREKAAKLIRENKTRRFLVKALKEAGFSEN